MNIQLRLQMAALMILAFIIIVNYSAKRRSTPLHRAFSLMVLMGFANVCTDLGYSYSVLVKGVPNLLFDKLYMATLPTFVSMVYTYLAYRVEEDGGTPNIKWKGLWHLPAALCILGVFTLPYAYGYDNGRIYGTGPVVSVVYGTAALYTVASIVLLVSNIKKVERRTSIVCLSTMLAYVVTMFGQLGVKGLVITSIGVVFIIVALSLIAENPDVLLIEQLQYEKDRANAANLSKSSFVAHMSHEIRTPINAILGMNEVILRESEEENIKQYSQDIANAAYSLYGIINDVLDVSKMESGKMDIIPVRYELNQLVYDAVALVRPKSDAKQLDFFVDINPTLPNVYYGDDIRLKQVIVNLLSNAIKYTHEGFVKLTVDGDYIGDYMELNFQIRDTGIGIREEDMSKLFVAFERIEEERNRNIEGTGLGMNITNNLLRLMGSNLDVSSTYGEGSIFSFNIMQRIIDQEPVGDFNEYSRQQLQYTSIGFTAPSVKILVVDDNAINRRVFMSLLNETNMRIDEAASGYECLDMIKATQYDMIFIDYLMPGIDGAETTKLMKESKDHVNRNTPIVLLTADMMDSLKDEYREAGFDAFLSKPIFSDELEKLIKTYIPAYKIELEGSESSSTELEEVSSDDWKEKLPTIRGINWTDALMHLPTEEILKATLTDFRKNILQDTRMLDSYVADIVDEEKLELFRIKIHALKGSAAMIGAAMLSEGAQELENAARNKDIGLIRERYPYLINYYRSFDEKLKPFSNDKAEKIKDIDFPQIIALIQMVHLEMNDLNKMNAIEALEEIEVYEFPEEIEINLEKLRMAIDDFDSELVGNLCEKIQVQFRALRERKKRKQ